MKLIFIGSGSAFVVGSDNYQSNMLLLNESTGNKLLIDCGSDARLALFRENYTYKDINNVYISHLHADHVGGLEWLALSTKFDSTCDKPTLFAHTNVLRTLWEHTLSGGLNTLQNEKAGLSSFFKVVEVSNDFQWDGITFQAVQTMHVGSGCHLMPSYGLQFTINKKSIYITTDSQFTPNQLSDFYRTSDIIFQDCETSKISSGVHAHFTELCKLPSEIKSKMWLYHYNSIELPDSKKYGFCGFVKRGQSFCF